MIALGIALAIGGLLILLVLALCRTTADADAVAKALPTPDDPSLPGDDLLDVWHAVSRDPDPVVRGFADEVAGWLRDFTEGVYPPVIRPAVPPKENDR